MSIRGQPNITVALRQIKTGVSSHNLLFGSERLMLIFLHPHPTPQTPFPVLPDILWCKVTIITNGVLKTRVEC